MKLGDHGYFVEFPGQSVFKITAVEGTTLFVTPLGEDGETAAAPLDQINGSMRPARLHAVTEEMSCTLDIPCSVTGAKLAFTEADGRLYKLIADQHLKGSVSVPAFFDHAMKKQLAAVAARETGEMPPYYTNAASADLAATNRPLRRFGAALCVMILAVTFGFLWLHQHLTISETSSLITSDYKLVASPVTGTVVYVNDDKSITAGEPIFGIEGTSGRPVIVNAPIDTTSFEAVASPGARVERGKALGWIADEAAAPQLVTYVTFSEALEIAKGAVAKVNFRDNSVSFLPLGLGDIRYSVRDQDTRDPVMKIQVQLPDRYRDQVGATASIQIRREGDVYRKLCRFAGGLPPVSAWCSTAKDNAT
ncbi:hypothetical protein [Roseibium sp. M-1]